MKGVRIHPFLRRRVASIVVLEAQDGDTLVLPSTGAVLGFQLRGRVRTPDSWLAPAGVTGIQTSAKKYSYAAGTASVLVRFTPEGAACLGAPGGELAGRSVPLDAILAPARVAEIRERLFDAGDDARRVAVVQDFLLALPHAGDALVSRAVVLLEGGTGDAEIASVARALGVSERQLERRFLARVGVTPKRFASLRRFERAVERAAHAPSLSVAALDAGYYDQSHFIRDFRRYVGKAPGELLGTR